MQRGHFVRQAGNVLVPRSTVYLVLHFMDLMNRSPYKKILGHVGMFPTMRNNQLFDRRNRESFSTGEVSIIFTRWSAQRSGALWRQCKVLDPEISSELLHLG